MELEACHVLGEAGWAHLHVAVGLQELRDILASLCAILLYLKLYIQVLTFEKKGA